MRNLFLIFTPINIQILLSPCGTKVHIVRLIDLVDAWFHVYGVQSSPKVTTDRLNRMGKKKHKQSSFFPS